MVIVSHREPRVEIWTRRDDGWAHTAAGAGEIARVVSPAATIDVDAVWADAREP